MVLGKIKSKVKGVFKTFYLSFWKLKAFHSSVNRATGVVNHASVRQKHEFEPFTFLVTLVIIVSEWWAEWVESKE